MRPERTLACALLAAVLPIAGCHRRVKVVALPPPPPVPVEMISVPPPTHPTEPEPEIALEDVPSITPQIPRRPMPRFRPTPATPAQTAAIAPAPPPPVDLGQLTTGGEAANSALRVQTEDLLRATQRRLATLPAATAALHSQQVAQARLFLRQADDAWKNLDVEGARNLATKAKVLLDEIQDSAKSGPSTMERPTQT